MGLRTFCEGCDHPNDDHPGLDHPRALVLSLDYLMVASLNIVYLANFENQACQSDNDSRI
jgi:hypothetical protein